MKNNTQIKVITQYNKLHSSTIGLHLQNCNDFIIFREILQNAARQIFFFNGNHLEMYNSKKIYNHFHIYSTSYL